MILARGLIPLVILALMVYCVLDIIATDDSRVRNLPKLPWLFIVILIPTIGAVAWLLLGRPEGAGFAIGGATPRRGYNPNPDPYPNRLALPEEQKPVLESREEAIRRWAEEKRQRQQEIEDLERALAAAESPPDPVIEPGSQEGSDDPDEPASEES